MNVIKVLFVIVVVMIILGESWNLGDLVLNNIVVFNVKVVRLFNFRILIEGENVFVIIKIILRIRSLVFVMFIGKMLSV